MTDFTDDQREALKERLASLDKARRPLLKAREPLDEAIHAIDEMADEAEADAGVEIVGNCEGCQRMLIVGDLAHQCADGPLFCETCAPTWNDLAAQYTDSDHLIVDDSEGKTVVTHVSERIAAGEGDKKHVWPL